MADSVDNPKSTRSMQGFSHFPNSEMLDARIASALNKISLEEQKAQKEDRFLRGRQIAHMIALMTQFLIILIYSLSLFATMMFRNLMRDGMGFFYL